LVQLTVADVVVELIHSETEFIGDLIGLRSRLNAIVDLLKLESRVFFHSTDDFGHLVGLVLGDGPVWLHDPLFVFFRGQTQP